MHLPKRCVARFVFYISKIIYIKECIKEAENGGFHWVVELKENNSDIPPIIKLDILNKTVLHIQVIQKRHFHRSAQAFQLVTMHSHV